MKKIDFNFIPQWKVSYDMLCASTNWVHNYNSYLIRYRGYLHNIGFGTTDDIEFWEDSDFLYGLAVNRYLGYCGLEVLALKDIESGFESVAFVDSEEDLESWGIDLDNDSSEEILNVLLQFL